MKFNKIFRALEHKNFRLFFAGQSISLIGTWMQYVAMSWMVYRMTNSALWLGVIGFVTQLPSFVISPLGGVFVDRYNRQRIIILGQVLAMLQAAVLTVLIFTGTIKLWEIIVLGMMLGLVSSLEIPARHAFIFSMIDKKEDLGNAIALNSFMFNLARLIGPSIAGILIGLWGEGVCFLGNTISYIPVIIALTAMRIQHKVVRDNSSHPWNDLKKGISYTFGFAPIRAILLLLGLMSMISMAQAALMPIFAHDILKGNAATLGFLLSATGVGALCGTIYLAAKTKVNKLVNLLPLAVLVFGCAIAVFAFVHFFWLALVVLFFSGFGLMVNMVASNTLLQTITQDAMRGRVMSFYTMAFMGMATVGTLLGGITAHKLGIVPTLFASGCMSILAAGIFLRQIPKIKKAIQDHNNFT